MRLEVIQRGYRFGEWQHQVEVAKLDQPATNLFVEVAVGAQEKGDTEGLARQMVKCACRDRTGPRGLFPWVGEEQPAMSGSTRRQANRQASQHRTKIAAAFGLKRDRHSLFPFDASRIEGVEMLHHQGFIDSWQCAPLLQRMARPVAAVEGRVLRGVGADLPGVLLLEAFQGPAAQVLPSPATPRKMCMSRNLLH